MTSQTAHQKPRSAGTETSFHADLPKDGASGSLPRQMSFAICFGRQMLKMGTNQATIAQAVW